MLRPFSRSQFRRFLWLLLVSSLLPGFQNCSAVHTGEQSSALSVASTFRDLNNKIFGPKCLSCHQAGTPMDLSSYASLMAGDDVVPGDAPSSKLYLRVVNGSMPKGGPPLSSEQVASIREWIANGALEDDGPVPVILPPEAPSALQAVAVSSAQINLTWTDNSDVETGIRVERSNSASGPWTALTTLSSSETAFSNTGLTASTTYHYRVTAFNSAGDSDPSASASATTPAPAVNPPSPPSNLTGTSASMFSVSLSWTDGSNNENNFIVERSTDGTTFTTLATLGAGVTTYQNTGLTAAAAYFYRIKASNTAGSSNPSNTVSVTSRAPTYTNLYAEIFQPRCTRCHSGNNPEGNYNLSNYTGTRARVVPNNAAGSRLYTEVQSGNMPEGGPRLNAAQVSAIQAWINGGALNN